MKTTINDVVEKIRKIDVSNMYGVIGFDGFVDEIVHVVDKRYDAKRFKRIETISEYGSRISRAAGLSTNIEVVTLDRKIGGNGPIFAKSLSDHGIRFSYIGALGYPNTAAVFDDFIRSCDAISISEPGYTDAVEFLDGKIIRSKLDGLKDVNWESLKRIVGTDKLKLMFQNANFFAFMNWSLVVNVTSLWKGLLDEIFPEIDNVLDRMLFIDLADPERRSSSDLYEALDIVKQMGKYTEVTLGLNKKEACEIAVLFGNEIEDFQTADTEELLDFLLHKTEVDVLVIHSSKSASVGRQGGPVYTVSGPYCKEPKLTTGAGDNFNAGFMFGRVGGLSIEESLYLAVYNSGFYVHNAYSPNTQTLIQFMEECIEKQI